MGGAAAHAHTRARADLIAVRYCSLGGTERGGVNALPLSVSRGFAMYAITGSGRAASGGPTSARIVSCRYARSHTNQEARNNHRFSVLDPHPALSETRNTALPRSDASKTSRRASSSAESDTTAPHTVAPGRASGASDATPPPPQLGALRQKTREKPSTTAGVDTCAVVVGSGDDSRSRKCNAAQQHAPVRGSERVLAAGLFRSSRRRIRACETSPRFFMFQPVRRRHHA